MADITLAELNEQVWLVGGEALIDDLLNNTLPANVSVEIIPCALFSEVHALWVQLCGPPDRTGDPWLIHPAIARRMRNSISNDHSVFFAQWSAMLDEDALMIVRAAAARARIEQSRPVLVVEYRDETAARAIADLAGLRAHLIEERLVEEGVQRARISRACRPVSDVPGMAQESQRVDIVVRDAE